MMCTALEFVNFRKSFKKSCCFSLELITVNNMHKANSQFRDKQDIKSFEHITALTSAIHNVYQSKQNPAFV